MRFILLLLFSVPSFAVMPTEFQCHQTDKPEIKLTLYIYKENYAKSVSQVVEMYIDRDINLGYDSYEDLNIGKIKAGEYVGYEFRSLPHYLEAHFTGEALKEVNFPSYVNESEMLIVDYKNLFQSKVTDVYIYGKQDSSPVDYKFKVMSLSCVEQN